MIHTWRSKHYVRRPRGFTLIELLLVIAIIAVLATLGIRTYEKRTESAKINKTALEIQQIIQGGMAHYTAKGCWPTWPKQANDPCPDSSRVMPSYIKVGGQGAVNPWGFLYEYRPDAGGRFEVRTEVPSLSIAERIAAQLPNAEAALELGKFVVFAQMTVPGWSQKGISIIYAKSIPDVTDAFAFPYLVPSPCPAGQVGEAICGLSGVKGLPRRWIIQSIDGIAEPVETMSVTCVYDQKNQVGVFFHLKKIDPSPEPMPQVAKADIWVMIVCKPKSPFSSTGQPPAQY